MIIHTFQNNEFILWNFLFIFKRELSWFLKEALMLIEIHGWPINVGCLFFFGYHFSYYFKINSFFNQWNEKFCIFLTLEHLYFDDKMSLVEKLRWNFFGIKKLFSFLS